LVKRLQPARGDGLDELAEGARTPAAPAPGSIRLQELDRLAAEQSIGADLDDTDLRGKVRHGVGWKLASVVFGQGSEVLISILLAHLLLPSDFGLAGLAIVFGGLAIGLSDVGLGAAIIQRKSLTEEDRSTVFWVTAMVGVALTLLGVAFSPLVAKFFSNPQVMPLFAVLSISFLFASLGQTQRALLTRQMSFRSLELRNIASTIAGALAALLFALGGFGAWAIIAQVVFTTAVSTLMLWTVSPWRPRMVFCWSRFRTLGGFGVKTFLMRNLVWVNLNGDNLLVGRFLGSTALGIYSVAYNIMVLPSTNITNPLRDVLYAAFARLQHDTRRLGEAWLRVNNIAGSLLVPAFLGLAAVAPDFVPAVLGPNWHEAIPVLQLLCVGAAVGSLQAFNGQVYQALGKPGLFLRFMCFATAVMFSAFVVGLKWGVVGVAGSYAVARTIMLIVNSVQMSRLMDFDLWRMTRSYLAIIFRAAAMGAVVFAARSALIDLGLPGGIRLVILIVGGTLVYLGLTVLLAPAVVQDVRDGLLRRRVATA
jgi:O-antigen/teichoic acid export membrane protein